MKLEVPAVVGSLYRVNALVKELAVAAALPEWDAYQLRLATEELFTNIVRHGYGVRERGELDRVVIEYGVTEEDVWVRLIDTAAPFDPFGVSAPPSDTLGLDLVRRAVSAASHEYVDGTNRTTVHVRRSARAGPEPSRRSLQAGPEFPRRA